MFDIYFSTVWRYAPNNTAGELVKVDWETGQVINRVAVGPKTYKSMTPIPGAIPVAVGGSRWSTIRLSQPPTVNCRCMIET